MSDNNKYHFEKEFVDHSWGQMRDLLDQEMPEKKKKRRFFFLFFLLGTLLGVTTLFYFSSEAKIEATHFVDEKGMNDNKSGLADNSSSPVQRKEDEIKSENKNDIKIEKASSNKNINAPGNKSTVKNNKGETKNKNTSREEIKINNYNINFPSVPLDQQPTNNLNDKFVVGNPVREENDIRITEGNDEVTPSTYVSLEKSNSVLVNKKNTSIYLSGLSMNSSWLDDKYKEQLNYDELTLIKEESEEKSENDSEKKDKKIKFGIEGGMNFVTRKEWGGKIAWVASRKIKEKLYFHFGLEYHMMRWDYNGVLEGGLVTLGTAHNDGSGNPAYQEQLSDYENSLTGNYSKLLLHNIKLPIQFGYRFHQKWEINAGAGITARLGKSKAIFSNTKNNNDLNFPTITDPADLSFVSNVKSLYKLRTTIDPFITTGISFYPKQNMAIGLRYDMGVLVRKLSFDSGEITVPTAMESTTTTIQAEYLFGGYRKKERNLGLFFRYYF